MSLNSHRQVASKNGKGIPRIHTITVSLTVVNMAITFKIIFKKIKVPAACGILGTSTNTLNKQIRKSCHFMQQQL